MEGGGVYFQVKWCPMAEHCTTDSFKRAAVWGWNESECKDRLIGHLTRSSLHQMTQEDAETAAEQADVEAMEWEPPRKRARQPTEPPTAAHYQQQQQEITEAEELQDVATSSLGEIQSILDAGGSSLGQNVTFRLVDFQAMMDSVNRAISAVKQAQLIAASATRAFGDEKVCLEQVKRGLQDIGAANGYL